MMKTIMPLCKKSEWHYGNKLSESDDFTLCLGSDSLVGSDGNHLVYVVDATSALQVVYRTSDTLQDRSYGSSVAQTFNQLVRDVSYFQTRNNQYISFSGDFRTRSFACTYSWNQGSVSLQFTVNFQCRSNSFAIFNASTTLSTTSCLAEPLVEKLNMATRG